MSMNGSQIKFNFSYIIPLATFAILIYVHNGRLLCESHFQQVSDVLEQQDLLNLIVTNPRCKLITACGKQRCTASKIILSWQKNFAMRHCDYLINPFIPKINYGELLHQLLR